MNTLIRRVAWLYTEISREYGIIGMNFTLMADGKKTPEVMSQEYNERQKKIHTYVKEVRELMQVPK